MTDMNSKPPDATGIMTQLSTLFSPATFAAIRYALTAAGTLLGLVGLTALSTDQIDRIIEIVKQIGTVTGAILALIGLVTPVAMGIIGYVRSTLKSQIESVRDIAKDKTASQTLSTDAQKALVAATISLDKVQTIVADKDLAAASPSASVVSKEDVAVVTKP